MEILYTCDMPGRWYTGLFEIAADQNGYITTDDVLEFGGTRQVLIDMHRSGQLQRVGHGIYRFTSFPPSQSDEFMQATLWPRGLGVISHDSALDLWELCDVNPAKIHITVPKKARIRRQKPQTYQIHERDLSDDEVTRFEGIPVVTPMRAIRDGIERHLDRRMINQAIDRAQRQGLISPQEAISLEAAS